MFEDKISKIQEQECKSDLENNIINAYNEFLVSWWDIDWTEQTTLEIMLGLNELSKTSVSEEVKAELRQLWINYKKSTCIEKTNHTESVLGEEIIPAENNLWWSEWAEISSEKREELIKFYEDNKNAIIQLLWLESAYNRALSVVKTAKSPYKLNYPTRVIPYYLSEAWKWIEAIDDFSDSYESVRKWDLVVLEQRSDLWVLDDSIFAKSYIWWRQTLRAISPEAKGIINTLGQELQSELWETFRVLRITSLFRPIDYNSKIWGSRVSAHIRGIGFDIGFYNNSHDNSVKKKLLELDKRGDIILTIERDHFHITVTKPRNIERIENPDFGVLTEKKALKVLNSMTSVLFDANGRRVSADIPDFFKKSFTEILLWLAKGESHQEYIIWDRLYWEHEFLLGLIRETVEKLSPEEKEEMKKYEIEVDVFVDNQWKANFGKRRIYLEKIIEPKIYEPDSDLLALKEWWLNWVWEWLSEDLEGVLFQLLREKLGGSDTIDIYGKKVSLTQAMPQIIKNIEAFVAFTAHMESDYIKKQDNGISSAKSVFQFLTWERDWISIVYNEWVNTSFQTWINRAIRLFSKLNGGYVTFYKQAFDRSKQSYLYSPLDFTTKQEVIMFFANVLGNDKVANDSHIISALIFGDPGAMVSMYEVYHHTHPDDATRNRIDKHKEKYTSRLWQAVDDSVIEAVWDKLDIDLLFSATLRPGDRGKRVILLQKMLYFLWYPVKWVKPWEETRVFGPATKNALIKFQKKEKIIDPNSLGWAWVFWPKTRKKMEEIYWISKVESRPKPRPKNFEEIIKKAKSWNTDESE